MTPAEHYERASELLEAATRDHVVSFDGDTERRRLLVDAAAVHATLAAVPWAGPEDLADDDVNGDLADVLDELAGWAHSATVVPASLGADAEAYVNGLTSAKGIVAGLVDPVLATLEAPRQ